MISSTVANQKSTYSSLVKIFIIFLISYFFNVSAYAACGATNITWGGAASTWNTAGNWSPANVPNAVTENVIINSGTVNSNATLSVGCITIGGTGVLNGSTAPARTITFRGDSFSAPAAGALLSFNNLSLVMGPHTTAGLPQTFTFNSAATMRALTIANASVPGGGVFGVTLTNLNAGTAIFTTLANTGLNSAKYIGNIRATTYTNNRANSLDIEAGTFQVNSLTNANTVTGGVLNINPGSRLITTTTFNPVAGFTTNVLAGSPNGILTVTTTSAPAGVLNLNGPMTTTQFNPTATSNVTIGSTGSLTSSGASTPLGVLTINGPFSSTTFNPGSASTVNINAGGSVTASSTSAPAGVLNVNGPMTTTQFNPTATSSTTIGSTGSIASAGASSILGTLVVNGSFSSTTLSTSKAVTVNAGGSINATTSMTPAAVAASVINVTGSITTPVFNPLASSSVTIGNGGVINATTSSAPRGAFTIDAGGTFNVGTYSPTNTSTTNVFGNMTVTNFTPAAAAIINVKSGGVLNVTTFTPNATSAITVEAGGTLNITTMTNALAATVNIAGTTTITNMPTMTSGILNIQNSGRLILTNGITLNAAGATIRVQAGGTLQVADTKTVTLTNGTFQTLGTEDNFPQNIATKAVIEALPGESFNFTTAGGTLNLVGFNFSRLGVNGLVIGGSTILSNLRGGQFTNLSTNYASMKAIQINTTGTIPAAATRIAWTWGAFNDFTGTTPTSSDAYTLVSSTGCAGRTIDFSLWSGDWYETQPSFNVMTKISAVGCTINMSGSASAVSLLYFNAVPFNGAIDLRWRTNAERMHLGFNVYRADMYSAQFQQINKTLIRNIKSSGSNQASYRFIDNDVVNGQRYYYYIEDVETSGKRVLHGPVSAIALTELGTPPADNPGENSDSNSKDPIDDGIEHAPDSNPIPNPTYEDLGGGIKILSKTRNSIRIEINPSEPTFSSSAWDTNFKDVKISGFSKMTLAGSPELPEKDLLIQVDDDAGEAHVVEENISEKLIAGHLISPAPDFRLSGDGILIPHFSLDSKHYAQSKYYPVSYYSIQNELITLNNEKFLKLKINPLKHNPVEQNLLMGQKIILDIGLDGDRGEVRPPAIDSQISPYSVGNVLKIDYTKQGMYQISFEDFVRASVERPFQNSAMANWRLYYKNIEIPLEIHSNDGVFGAGDFIRFYAPFEKIIDSKKNQIILSPVAIMDSQHAPKRIQTVDADPGGQESTGEPSLEFSKTLEQNLRYIDGVTLNDNLDHFFYADLVNYPGMDTLNITTNLSEIDLSSSTDVEIKVHVRGRPSMSGLSYKHHLALSVSGQRVGEAVFEENERKILSFMVPANHFSIENNTLSLKVLGSFTPQNENDFILIDKIEIIYRGSSGNHSGVNNFITEETSKVHQLNNLLTNELYAYDLTEALDPKRMMNLEVTTSDGGSSFEARFFADDDSDEQGRKRYSLLAGNSFLKPVGLALNSGISESLKNSSHRADLIIFGTNNLINAISDLVERREAQGLEVMAVTPEEVYGEFSYGVVDSNALKSFIQTALNNWDKAPKYLLILGDGTYDPADYNVLSLAPHLRSSLEKSTLPAPLMAGRFIDFSGDNFFVSPFDTHVPKIAVGRLPTNDPEKIKDYVEKIQKFENGEASPSVEKLKSISFFADQDLGDFERFNEHSKSMMSAASAFQTTLFDRLELGSKPLTKAKIYNEINSGLLMVSLMGHGAFDRFGDDLFSVNDAKALTNEKYPIIANWNCESAYYYDANNTYKSLGEELIFNPEGGAIVYMGSTTQTTPSAQTRLAQNFFNQLSLVVEKPWKGIRFGELLLNAKIGVGDDLYQKDILNSFSILGDPSLKLPEELFATEEKTEKISTPDQLENDQQSGSSFGCSVFAGETNKAEPWYAGVIEFAIYMLLIVWGTRKVTKRLVH